MEEAKLESYLDKIFVKEEKVLEEEKAPTNPFIEAVKDKKEDKPAEDSKKEEPKEETKAEEKKEDKKEEPKSEDTAAKKNNNLTVKEIKSMIEEIVTCLEDLNPKAVRKILEKIKKIKLGKEEPKSEAKETEMKEEVSTQGESENKKLLEEKKAFDRIKFLSGV